MSNTNIEVGKVKKIGGRDFIILDILENGILCLLKDLAYESMQFDENLNNYANSKVRKRLNTEFISELSAIIGGENIISFEIDLTSDDGLDDYGRVTDRVGLLTADMYRKYNRIIEQYPINNWWWLSTPWSTPHRGYRRAVRCVYDNGVLNYYGCRCSLGVRPFCIFSSSIFQS